MKMNKNKQILQAFFYLILPLCVCCSSNTMPDSDPPIKKDGEKVEDKPMKVTDFIKDYKLTFEDNFNGMAIDFSKWKYRAENTVRQYATVSRETIQLDGEGNLVIQTLKKDGKYYVGQLTTDGLFNQRYGYFECRAKVNRSLGTHCAFWLQTNTMGVETNDPQNNGVEIDIFEYHRKTSNQVHHNLHWNGYGQGHKQEGISKYVLNIGTGFHTFGLLWTEKEYIFFVDGEESWRTTKAVSRIPEYMILSTELTGFGGDPNAGQYPDSVVFDYVRTYIPR